MEDPKLYFLVVVEIPSPVGTNVSAAWIEFLKKIKDTNVLPGLPVHNQSIHGEQLSENSWLLNGIAGLPFLARLVAVAGLASPQIRYTVATLNGTVQLLHLHDNQAPQKSA